FNTLAQIGKKETADVQKKQKEEQRAFEVVRNEEEREKVDVQYVLERKIIESLMLYGTHKEEFEDLVLKENESGDLILEPESMEIKVYEKIYLDLQEDEIELANEDFRKMYTKLIEALNEEEEFSITNFVNGLDQEMANQISSILMEEERYKLDNWESKEIYPKKKEIGVAQLVSETILTLRCYLIKKRMGALQKTTEQSNDDNREALEEIMNYIQLNKLLNQKLNRVLS
ncbi:MAG: DNA primase, partial [Maribacter arcticus]